MNFLLHTVIKYKLYYILSLVYTMYYLTLKFFLQIRAEVPDLGAHVDLNYNNSISNHKTG